MFALTPLNPLAVDAARFAINLTNSQEGGGQLIEYTHDYTDLPAAILATLTAGLKVGESLTRTPLWLNASYDGHNTRLDTTDASFETEGESLIVVMNIVSTVIIDPANAMTLVINNLLHSFRQAFDAAKKSWIVYPHPEVFFIINQPRS